MGLKGGLLFHLHFKESAACKQTSEEKGLDRRRRRREGRSEERSDLNTIDAGLLYCGVEGAQPP